jgi:hypothetical protein
MCPTSSPAWWNSAQVRSVVHFKIRSAMNALGTMILHLRVREVQSSILDPKQLTEVFKLLLVTARGLS